MTFPVYTEATYIENWPRELLSLSMRTASLEMSVDDVVALGSYSRHFRQNMGITEVFDLSEDLCGRLSATLSDFPQGVMPRLGHCSWKGSMISNTRIRSLRELMSVITRPDDRISKVLINAASHRHGLKLHLREWVDISPENEFRTFVKSGKVVEISQYYWRDMFDLRDDIHPIRSNLKHILRRIVTASHMDTFIADVCVGPNLDGRSFLIEINPWIDTADHCLYQTRDFDGRLRFREDDRVMAVAL